MQAFRSDPLEELVIPDGTHVEEHDLVTDRDVIVGGQSTVEFGVRGGTVIAGERVSFGGHIEAEGDCRLDMWCDVADTVLVGEDAYIGERVHVGGELRVAGDLDIGDDVDIEDGFEANGWIVIRNPTPTLVFLFIYLSQLLRLGEDEKAESMLTELLEDEREAEPVVIPRNSHVSDDAWRVSAPGRIGSDCRLHGNIRAESLVVGRDNEIFGSLRAKDGITLGANSEVTGNVTTRKGTVRIGPDVTVRGDVSGEFVEVHQDADIEGAIRASEETTMVNENVVPYQYDSRDENREDISDTDDADVNETDDVDASAPDDANETDTAETESGKTTGMQSN
ncbi:polymer-forming cytoskeletal protein [Halovenus marina]|uniref:polymer-forming cytoskeletal protein n=1 Tax=Halovenus marina TaxID=3396621 RepID=UPI003F55D7CF